jgi:hypothetical protein
MNYDPKAEYIKQSDTRAQWAGNDLGASMANSTVGGTIRGGLGEDPKIGSRAVPQAASQLEKDLYLLGECLNELRNRLSPVMRSARPEVANEQTKSQMSDVPMVAMIACATGMVRTHVATVQDLVGRLEV